MSTQRVSTGSRVCRPGTEAFHRQAVERAVAAMRRRFSEEGLGLSAIAAEAISSPFHFARFFRRIAGVPPGHFLTAVRMHTAKQLLVETGLSVTNVCFEVGYSSLGTFTRRFTELVGLPPLAFRRTAQLRLPLQDLTPFVRPAAVSGTGTIEGYVATPVPGRIAIGLFPSALAQGRPVACCLVKGPGPYRITGVPRGRYFVLAAALEPSGRLAQEPELRGAGSEPIELSEHLNQARVDVQLRPRQAVDPPIVLSLPALLVIGIRAHVDAPVKARLRTRHAVAR
jgi:AraC-like DNA-binding protein